MTGPGITVVIPSVPPRAARLRKALQSVEAQTLRPDRVVVHLDREGLGAPKSRNAGLMTVTTPWVAFLDDDDWFYPQHLERLHTAATDGGADYVWSWFDLIHPGGVIRNDCDPLGHFGKQWDDATPTQTTITTLVRTDLAQQVGFDHDPHGEWQGQRVGEDFLFTLGVRALGATMLHVPERTWAWAHHGYNLSGRPWRSADMLPIAMNDPLAV